jgi:hypothetical protein
MNTFEICVATEDYDSEMIGQKLYEIDLILSL